MEKNRLLNENEIHKMLTGILEAFAVFCEKNDLRYYLVGGTLLGAVRHQGFIPWDDDIDVGMPRSDYQRFLKLAAKQPIGKHLKVVSDQTNDFAFPYAEIIRTDTRLERESGKYIKEDLQVQHLFIDIFPQDGWPSEKHQQEQLLQKMNRLRFLIHKSRARLGKGNGLLRTVLKMPIVLYAKAIGNEKLSRQITKTASQIDYDHAEFVGSVTNGIYGMGEVLRREDVIRFDMKTFEGRKYPVPGCWDAYLGGIYGDYMKLPPKEKRINHKMKVYQEL